MSGGRRTKKPQSFLIEAWKLVGDESYFNSIIFLMPVKVVMVLDDVAVMR
jgi:hypothetical protein